MLPQLRVHYKRTEIEEKFVDHDETYTGPDGNPSTRTSKALMNITKIVDGHYDVDGVVICVGMPHQFCTCINLIKVEIIYQYFQGKNPPAECTIFLVL